MAGRVVTIAQQKGGAGKTTVAAHLGLAWLALGRRVAFVDIDPQGSLSRWFALREASLGVGNSGVTLSTVTGWRATTEIERLGRSHDVVVVDSPPHAQTDAKIAVRAASLVVAPVQPSPLDVWATKPTIELCAAEHKKIVLVLNRVPSRSPLTDDMISVVTELGAELARGRLGNRSGFASSMVTGRTITELAANTVAAREINKLARELLARIGS